VADLIAGDRPPTASAGGGVPIAFHLMAKPTGAICNLDCEYCFFLSKEQLYPDSPFRMNDDVQRAYLTQMFAAQVGVPEVVVAWQGGEPTMMGLDFFRRSIEIVNEVAQPGQQVLHTLQTNGTLLNDEWGEFLKVNNFLVGISIDGPRAMHDAYRVDKGGKPTYDRVIRGLDVLKKHDVDWNVLTTIHAANGDHGRAVYTFLRDELGAAFVQFIPIIERATPETFDVAETGWGHGVRGRPLYVQDGSLVTHRSVGPEQFGRFMIEVFEEWVRHDVGRVFVQLFDTTLANTVGVGGGMCVHAKTCGRQLAIEHNGDVYSCDHFVEPNYLLGNITDRPMLDLVTSPQQIAFGNDKRDTLPDYCRKCDVLDVCNGGCPKDRFSMTPDGAPGLHYLCPGYLEFFHHVREPMGKMADLLRANRYADELMAEYVAADAKRPRNSPCPCGSGRKWKHCHAAPAGMV
jgi:uncharacterized protein